MSCHTHCIHIFLQCEPWDVCSNCFLDGSSCYTHCIQVIVSNFIFKYGVSLIYLKKKCKQLVNNIYKSINVGIKIICQEHGF